MASILTEMFWEETLSPYTDSVPSTPSSSNFKDDSVENGDHLRFFEECSLDNSTCTSSDNYNDSISYFISEDPLKAEDTSAIDLTCLESKAKVAGKLLDDLNHLEHLDQWIKEEPLLAPDWLEEKIDLPFDYASTINIQSYPVQNNQSIFIPKTEKYSNSSNDTVLEVYPNGVTATDTQTLLQEFETVFGEVEMTHATLTPPQSPQQQNTIFTIMQPVPVQQIPNDYSQELAVVDELVRSRAESLVDANIWSKESLSSEDSFISEQTILDSSYETLSFAQSLKNTSPLSPSSTSCSSSSEESIDDPEWIPETVKISETPIKQKKSNRTKPYSRPMPVTDKKSRKKEQNKNAATRYRQKKKAEIEIILSEEKGLQDHNDKLQAEADELSREIKYLKGLMREVFKASGKLK